MKLTELDTPALVVDLDIMEGNLRRMADYCHQHRLALRPHIKTHKSPLLARRQIDLGSRWSVLQYRARPSLTEAPRPFREMAWPLETPRDTASS